MKIAIVARTTQEATMRSGASPFIVACMSVGTAGLVAGLLACQPPTDMQSAASGAGLVRVRDAVAADCTNGGKQIQTGPDDNDNGSLDDAEVDAQQTVVICRGVPGRDGAPGTDGVDGSDGADGQNGSDGADGQNGSDGADGQGGSDGADGQGGSDGTNSLVRVRAAASSECSNGGRVIEVGVDRDADGRLADAEVDAAQRTLVCNGVYVTVKDSMFGALGDGRSDDQPAIQAAVDYVCSRGGGEVYVPPGHYVITSAREEYDPVRQGVIKNQTVGVNLCSNLIFKMDPAAVLQARSNEQAICAVLAVGRGSDNVVITGGQLRDDNIDGEGSLGWPTQCQPHGGVRAQFGLDRNRNAVLDADEIDPALRVAGCNQPLGDSKINMATLEGPTGNCGNIGGREVKFGLDTDVDRYGIYLQPYEVNQTHYACNADGYTMLVSVRRSSREWCHGITIDAATHVHIDNVTTNNFWGDGISVWGDNALDEELPAHITIKNAVVQRNGRQGIALVSCVHCRIETSLFSHNWSADIDLEPDRGVTHRLRDISITGSLFHGSGTGVNLWDNWRYKGWVERSTDVVITDNTFTAVQHNAIQLARPTRTLIAGNRVADSGGGISVESAREILVTQNTIEDVAGSALACSGDEVSISGNVIRRAGPVSVGTTYTSGLDGTRSFTDNVIEGPTSTGGTVFGALGGLFARNTVAGDLRLYGLRNMVIDNQIEGGISGGSQSIIMRNTVTSTGHALHLDYGGRGSIITDNIFVGQGADDVRPDYLLVLGHNTSPICSRIERNTFTNYRVAGVLVDWDGSGGKYLFAANQFNDVNSTCTYSYPNTTCHAANWSFPTPPAGSCPADPAAGLVDVVAGAVVALGGQSGVWVEVNAPGRVSVDWNDTVTSTGSLAGGASTLFTHTYDAPGTYRGSVRFCLDEAQVDWCDVREFQVTVVAAAATVAKPLLSAAHDSRTATFSWSSLDDAPGPVGAISHAHVLVTDCNSSEHLYEATLHGTGLCVEVHGSEPPVLNAENRACTGLRFGDPATFRIPTPVSGSSYCLTATVSDAAGNTATASDAFHYQ